MYGYEASFFNYGYSDPAISRSLYGNFLSPASPAFEYDYDDDDHDRRRPRPRPRPRPPSKNPSQHRHDGSSPLPLGMDWSLPPRVWDGRDSIWPHDSSTGWSYCVTIPSWTILSASGSDAVFFKVQVGIQSPGGITTTRGVLRRFNEFLKLYSELGKEFPKKKLPPPPPRRLMKMRNRTLLEERRSALEDWVEKLLSDIDVSRTALVAVFLELEAAARSSFYESNPNESVAALVHRTVPSDQSPPNSGASLIESSSSVASDLGDSSAHETSDLGAPRPEKENYAGGNTENASDRGVTDSVNGTSRDKSSVNVIDDLRQDSAEGEHVIINQQEMLSRRDNDATDTGLESDLGGLARSKSVLVDRLELPENVEGLQGDSVVALPSEEQHTVNRAVVTMQQRLGTAKMDMEDLICRLNQEIVARKYLATKVKDLEAELETATQNNKETLQKAIFTERERCNQMQWDMEELRKKCRELEMRLASEQELRVHTEAMEASIIQQNEILMKELDDAKEQIESLKKQQDEVESKSKSDVKLLVKEVKSLRTSHSELKQELSRCLEEKHALENMYQKEKQSLEVGESSKVKILSECEVLLERLRECSVDFLVEEEGKRVANADAIDLLSTVDNRIGGLLEEARLLAATADEDDNGDLRMLLADIFMDDARLRKQVNSVIRHALSKPGDDSVPISW